MRPSLAARALPIVTWGLTFHILMIVLLFGLLHVPTPVVQGIAAWKETIGVLLLVAITVRAVAGRGPRVSVAMADLFAGGWIALALVTFATENIVWRDSISLKGGIFGLRDAAFFVIFYFIGRATPEIGDDDRVLQRAFAVLSITSFLAILEQLIVTPVMLVAIGVGSYVKDFLGTEVATQNNVYGLPDNYWSLMGGHMVRRSGSVFLSSQAFAVVFLVLLPAATLWVLQPRKRGVAFTRVAYAVIWLGLAVTFTRAAIVVGALQVLAILLLTKRVTNAALAAMTAVGVVLVAVVAMPGLATFVFETLTWQSGSSLSHTKDWMNGITAFMAQPWGHGLGTTDQTALRVGVQPLTADNLYLKYAVELGAQGLLLLLGTLGSMAIAGARLWRFAATESQAGIGLTVALAVGGVAVYGMTSTMLSDPLLSYLLFWLGGTAVTLAQRLPIQYPEHGRSLGIAYG